jgi:hypothetical protein
MGKWQMKLIAPNGEELLMDQNFGGYAGTCAEHTFVMCAWRKWLAEEDDSIPSHNLLRLAGSQALLNSAFMQFHNYRLTWGDTNPLESVHVCYPNGRDLNWSIYWCANGIQRLKLSGSLPEGWWDMDEEERQFLAEECLRDYEEE